MNHFNKLLAIALFVVSCNMVAGEATARCFDWVQLGTWKSYTIGSSSFLDVNWSNGQIQSESRLHFWYESAHSECRANHDTNLTQIRINHYTNGQQLANQSANDARNCQAFFTTQYRKYAGKLCNKN